MGDHIDTRFRPSLLIFVGEAGKQILEQVGPENLLAYLDKPLRQCVALLYCDTSNAGNVEIFSSDPLDRSLKNDPDIPKGSGPRREMIEQALKSVQMNRRRLALERAGYPVPNPRTQIFIIGDLADHNPIWMSQILGDVQDVVRSNRFQTPVCYVLNSYKSPAEDYSYTLNRPIDTTLANAKGLSITEPARWLEWSDYDVANFSYLYEHMISYPFPVFLSKREVQYASAEALFALIATGIPSSTLFEEEMRLPATFKNYADLIGNLNTSMVMFPYVAARKYSGSKLSSDLVKQWREALSKRTLTEDEQRKFRLQAHEIVRDIVFWMRDSEPRPYAEESLWPTLSILKRNIPAVPPPTLNRQAETYRALIEQMGRLFRVLDAESVQDEYEGQAVKTQSWANLASKRFGEAVDFYREWDATAIEAWDLARERSFDIIQHTVDHIWPEGEMGFENARVFAVELFNQLARLDASADQWRQAHDKEHRNDLNYFISLLQEQGGGWNNMPGIRGVRSQRTPRATPTMGGQGPVIAGGTLNLATGGSVTGGGTNNNSQGTLAPGLNAMSHSTQEPYHLPTNEEDIADSLRKRALWKESLVPSWPLLGATGFLGWLTAALTTPLTGLPATGVLAIDVGVALSFLATGLSINLRRNRELRKARQEVLDFYRQHYIYNCEHREDLQRIDILRTLGSRVRRIRDNLEHIHDFFANIQQEAERRMETINDELFDTSITARDIFVANGELLQRDGTHTLESISQKVTQVRLSKPLQPWHSSPDEMKRELIRMFQDLPESLLMMTEAQAQEHIYDFTTQIVDGYFTGSLVDIGSALDKKDIWDDVLDRVKKPLYFSTGAVREPLYVFVCGNAQDLANGLKKNYIPSDQKTITVQTKNRGWLLVAAFFRSGDPGVVNTLDLFWPKRGPGGSPPSAPAGPPPSVGGGGPPFAPAGTPSPAGGGGPTPPTAGPGGSPPIPGGGNSPPIPAGGPTAGSSSPSSPVADPAVAADGTVVVGGPTAVSTGSPSTGDPPPAPADPAAAVAGGSPAAGGDSSPSDPAAGPTATSGSPSGSVADPVVAVVESLPSTPVGEPTPPGSVNIPPAQDDIDWLSLESGSTPPVSQDDMDWLFQEGGSTPPAQEKDTDFGNPLDAMNNGDEDTEQAPPPQLDDHNRYDEADRTGNRSSQEEIDAAKLPPESEEEIDAPRFFSQNEEEIDAAKLPPESEEEVDAAKLPPESEEEVDAPRFPESDTDRRAGSQ